MRPPVRLLCVAVLIASLTLTTGWTPVAAQQGGSEAISPEAQAWMEIFQDWDDWEAETEESADFLLELYLALIHFLYGPLLPKPPEKPPVKPPEKPPVKNDDVIEIHGDSSGQNIDVIPTAGDGAGPVDEVMEPESGYTPVAFRRPPALAAPFVVFTADRAGSIQMRVIGPAALRPSDARLLTRGEMVLMPVTADVRRRIESFVASVATRGSGLHMARMTLRSYCLESAKKSAPVGGMFVPADRATQTRLAGVRIVRRAAEFAAARGFLKPQGDPVAYGRFVAQYAIWTRLEHWDRARFTAEFITRTKQAYGDEHRAWTAETEPTLRALASARWADVQLVMSLADAADHRLRRSAPSERRGMP